MPLASRRARSRFAAITVPFFRSEGRLVSLGMLVLLVLFILGLGGLNVLSSFMNRDFMTAAAERDASRTASLAALWVGVFAALTVVAVLKAFTEERLRLRWRRWLTDHLIGRYLAGRAYYRMKSLAHVDNPDQRISEDVKTFTDHALALLLIFVNSAIQLATFSGILWSISPWLFLAAILYTVFGTSMTVVLGSRLVKLDVQQFKKEADLRYDLIQVRANAEPIALLGGEPDEKRRLGGRLQAVVDNMKGVIGLSRNISFFTVGYDYLTQLIPLLIVVPLYIRGQAEFGMVTQSVMAFAFVVNAFSLIVKEFQRLSTFGAVVERLGGFYEALEEESPTTGTPPRRRGSDEPRGTPADAVEVVEDDTRVAFENLTLVTPRDGRVLVKDLTLEVPEGGRLLITGPSGSGRTTLLRAAAGLWTTGQGKVFCPRDGVLFLPQKPYLRQGTLRDQLVYASGKDGVTDERLLAVLRSVRFEGALSRLGGLDADRDWAHTLSLGEQQQVAFARLLLAEPRFAFLDEPTSALDGPAAQHLYEVLSRTPTTYVSVSNDAGLRKYHAATLELQGNGLWREAPRRVAVPA